MEEFIIREIISVLCNSDISNAHAQIEEGVGWSHQPDI